MQTDSQPQTKSPGPLVKKFSDNSLKNNLIMITLAVVVVGAGIASGWVLSGSSLLGEKSKGGEVSSKEKLLSKEMDIDESQFDTAEGILKKGGLENEGTHRLERGDDTSKNVYLTSTAISLDGFIDKEVQIWGETIAGQEAGWLMDVAKVRVLK